MLCGSKSEPLVNVRKTVVLVFVVQQQSGYFGLLLFNRVIDQFIYAAFSDKLSALFKYVLITRLPELMTYAVPILRSHSHYCGLVFGIHKYRGQRVRV